MPPSFPVIKSVADFQWRGKTAVVRADFNVPLDEDGGGADDSRIRAALPTLRHILDSGGKIVALSHLGRPKPGDNNPAFSLAPVAARLGELLGEKKVAFLPGVPASLPSDARLSVLENTRLNKGEKENAPALAAAYAKLGDIFVLDAFATAHRMEASTAAVAGMMKHRCGGLLLLRELSALSRALEDAKRPLIAVVGGAKISSKLACLQRLLTRADFVIAGGGVANTMLAAAGNKSIGASLVEETMINDAKKIIAGDAESKKIVLPEDAVVAADFHSPAREVAIDDIGANDKILDVGANTRKQIVELIKNARTIIWSGPPGAFEYPPFAAGTLAVANAVAAATKAGAFSLAGGGDTIAAINRAGVAADISYISTGGGAFLQYLEGKTLPAVAALQT